MWVGVSFNRSKFCVSLTCRHVLGMAPLAPVAGRRAASLSLSFSGHALSLQLEKLWRSLEGSAPGPYAKAAEIKEPAAAGM